MANEPPKTRRAKPMEKKTIAQLDKMSPKALRLELKRAKRAAKEAAEYLAEVLAEKGFYDREERATWRAEAEEAAAYASDVELTFAWRGIEIEG